ncbi:MAG: 16S rRNA (guanine(527)-N(7))-methyltransferase RsmG [Lachnospiraceae bacterium]
MERFAEKEERICYLKKELMQADIYLENGQIHQLDTYYQMLVEKNKVMNLTAITAFEEVVQKHFIDSMMLLRYADLKEKKVIDVGTGAGFPGIPLKIACPDAEIVLLDSLNKRVQFLREVMDALHLEKIQAIHGRAEDMAKKEEYRECFDYCVSRAVANLSTLSEYGMPFVQIGGCFVSYKSGEIEEELRQAENAIRILGGEKEKMESFLLPDSDISRSLIFIRKKKKTLKKYPRKAGMPSKEPLK